MLETIIVPVTLVLSIIFVLAVPLFLLDEAKAPTKK